MRRALSTGARRAALLAGERGTIRRETPAIVALGYPAPYGVAVSSLGFQTVYRAWNALPGLTCVRFFAAEGPGRVGQLLAAETGRPVAAARAIAFSVSCETELQGLVRLLRSAGLSPLAAERGADDPPVIVGGPLTSLDPRLVAPFADAVVVGEAEELLEPLGEAIVSARGRDEFLDAIGTSRCGLWRSLLEPEPPEPAVAPVGVLPAFAATWSSAAELKDLFLVEATRGCARACAFCVLARRSGGAGVFRAVPAARILAAVTEGAPGVGLVGAAVTDHPEIEDIVRAVVARGRRASLSSIRADRLTPGLASALVAGGLATITLSADGASQRLRDRIRKGITGDDLARAASVAASAGARNLKIYAMAGLPTEEDEDVLELAALVRSLDARLRLSVAVQAFVPKPGTPLAREPMADPGVIRRRVALLRSALAGRATVLPTSPRWSWLDWKLAHSGRKAALAAVAAERAGGGFGAWRAAIEELGL
ncbi:MAG: radical SAM protein [Deltaproteobacteria bacterium]|nr:radical SAM protein [Deltaproteobacteria bacterium]